MNEPNVLKSHIAELMSRFPFLKLITGDAMCARRPLAETLLDEFDGIRTRDIQLGKLCGKSAETLTSIEI